MGTDSPDPVKHGAVTLGALVLVLCALVAATFDGPRRAELRGEEDRTTTSEEDRQVADPDESTAEDSQEPADDDEPWIPWLPPLDLLLLVPTALIFGVALFVVARLRLVRRRRQLTRRIGTRHSAGLEDELPPDEEVEGLPEAVGAGARTIGEGSPRNAIVAAWVRLEQAVEGERFPHRPEETPSELVERALAAYRMDDGAIRRLAALYREARFSSHPITEEHRQEATDCLRRLLATLGTGAR